MRTVLSVSKKNETLDKADRIVYNDDVNNTASGRADGDTNGAPFISVLVELIYAAVGSARTRPEH